MSIRITFCCLIMSNSWWQATSHFKMSFHVSCQIYWWKNEKTNGKNTIVNIGNGHPNLIRTHCGIHIIIPNSSHLLMHSAAHTRCQSNLDLLLIQMWFLKRGTTFSVQNGHLPKMNVEHETQYSCWYNHPVIFYFASFYLFIFPNHILDVPSLPLTKLLHSSL